MESQEWFDQQANCSPELRTDHPICCIGSLQRFPSAQYT